MNNLLYKTIVDVNRMGKVIVFFCNDADYYYESSSDYYWIDSFLVPFPVEEIVEKESGEIEIGATLTIKFMDEKGKLIKGNLLFIKKL